MTTKNRSTASATPGTTINPRQLTSKLPKTQETEKASIYFPDDIWSRVQIEAALRGIPANTLIVMAVRAYFPKLAPLPENHTRRKAQ
jgi:hypothetical protein